MTPDELDRLLVEVVAADRAAAERFLTDPARPGLRWTRDCVSLPRLAAWVAGGVREMEGLDEAHARTCVYCQAAVRKLGAPPPAELGITLPSELATRHAVWAEPDLAWNPRLLRGGGGESVATPGGPVARVWRVGDEPGPDGGTLPLAPDLVARCYDTPDVRRVAVVVTATPRPGGGWEPSVELDPGPNRDAVLLTVTFADGTSRDFLVAPNPPGELRAAVAGPAEPVPEIAVDPAGGWQGTVALE